MGLDAAQHEQDDLCPPRADTRVLARPIRKRRHVDPSHERACKCVALGEPITSRRLTAFDSVQVQDSLEQREALLLPSVGPLRAPRIAWRAHGGEAGIKRSGTTTPRRRTISSSRYTTPSSACRPGKATCSRRNGPMSSSTRTITSSAALPALSAGSDISAVAEFRRVQGQMERLTARQLHVRHGGQLRDLQREPLVRPSLPYTLSSLTRTARRTIVGEWIPARDDCASYSWSQGSSGYAAKYGKSACQGRTTALGPLSDAYKVSLRKSFEVQTQVYECGSSRAHGEHR